MSTKHDLPPELAGFEAKLRAEPLTGSAVDRDELMYQAGWAAAEASRKIGWLWPTSSGVLAASVLVLATLSLEGLSLKGPSLKGPEEPRTVAIAEVALPQPEKKANVLPVVSNPQPFILRWTHRSPFLAMRDRALRMEFDEPVSFVGPVSFVDIDDDYAPKAVTARELMQEFLGETS